MRVKQVCRSVVSAAMLVGGIAVSPAQAVATSEVGALMHIRGLIATADHDYHGHRLAALKAIEDACRSLGVAISGDGHDRTLQGNSDAMLRQAGREIANLQPVAAANHQARVLEDLDRASKRIEKALAVK